MTHKEKILDILHCFPDGLTCAEICEQYVVYGFIPKSSKYLPATVSSYLKKMVMGELLEYDIKQIGPRGGRIYKIKFIPEVIIPHSMPNEYYLIDNIPVSKEEFEKGEGETTLIHCKSSVTHVSLMTYTQIVERFGDQLSDKEKETLQSLTKKQYSGPGILEQLREGNQVQYTKGVLTEEQLNNLRL